MLKAMSARRSSVGPLTTLRTVESESRSKVARAQRVRDRFKGCLLCQMAEEESVARLPHWRVVENELPLDKIAQRNWIVLPRRCVARLEKLTGAERSEFQRFDRKSERTISARSFGPRQRTCPYTATIMSMFSNCRKLRCKRAYRAARRARGPRQGAAPRLRSDSGVAPPQMCCDTATAAQWSGLGRRGPCFRSGQQGIGARLRHPLSAGVEILPVFNLVRVFNRGGSFGSFSAVPWWALSLPD